MITPLEDRTPQVDPTAWVAPSAQVIGDVRIGPEASVWYGAVLRGDTESITLGAGSNLQDGCVVHADPGSPCHIGEGVVVGHRAVLHGCRIEDAALIGIGAIVMNGAVVGAGSLVGAGTLVPEGVVIPSGSLVLGSPGRVRRETTQAERQRIRDGAARYRELRLTHRSAGG